MKTVSIAARALVESNTRFSGWVKKRVIERVSDELMARRDGSGAWTRYLLAELVARGRAQAAVKRFYAAIGKEAHSLDSIPLELQICRWLYSWRYTFVGSLGVELIAELELSMELLTDETAMPRIKALAIRKVLATPRARLRIVLESMKANGNLQKAVDIIEVAMTQGGETLAAACAWVELLASCDREGLLEYSALHTYRRAVGMLGQLHIVHGGGGYFTQ